MLSPFQSTHAFTFSATIGYLDLLYKSDKRISNHTIYSLLRPFLRFSANQFAQNFKLLANLITYFVSMCNIYKVNH